MKKKYKINLTEDAYCVLFTIGAALGGITGILLSSCPHGGCGTPPVLELMGIVMFIAAGGILTAVGGYLTMKLFEIKEVIVNAKEI